MCSLSTAPHKSNAREGFRTNSVPGESVFLLNLLFTSTKRAKKKKKLRSQVSSLCLSKQSGKQKSGIVRTIWLASLGLAAHYLLEMDTPERDKAHWAAEVECSNYISNSPPKWCSLVRSSPVLQTLHMSLSTLNWLSPTCIHVKHKAVVTSSKASHCARLVPVLRQTIHT